MQDALTTQGIENNELGKLDRHGQCLPDLRHSGVIVRHQPLFGICFSDELRSLCRILVGWRHRAGSHEEGEAQN